MIAFLQKQRVGDNRRYGRKRQRANSRILRAVQSDPHRQTTIGIQVNGRTRASAAPRLVLFRIFSRHFSSPEGDVGSTIGRPEVAWQYCLLTLNLVSVLTAKT